MLRVALVRALSQSPFKEPAEPLGIEALAAVLRANGIDYRLFDRELESLDTVVNAVADYQPSLLGISILMEDNTPDALRILAKVRKRHAVVCVLGGMFITTNYDKARALFPGDCRLIAGEGETALLKLCSELSGQPYPDMERQHLEPEEWPWMVRHNLEAYLAMGAPINMKSSRGCPGRCKFCATPSLPYGLDKWRGRPVTDVADEMQALCSQYKPPVFNFVDDDFGPLSRLEQLVDELARRDLHCALSLQLRADAICRVPDLAGLMAKLRAGGLSRVFIGLESFDAEALSYFNKKMDPVKVMQAFQTIRDAGIAIHIGYILWHPLSTIDSVRREARLLMESGFFTTKIVMARLQLFPGCELRREYGDRDHTVMPVDAYCDLVTSRAEPLYNVWLKGALDVPLRYCLACVEPDGDSLEKAIQIETQLNRLDALSYQLIMDPQDDSVCEAIVLETAEDVRTRLQAIGSNFWHAAG